MKLSSYATNPKTFQMNSVGLIAELDRAIHYIVSGIETDSKEINESLTYLKNFPGFLFDSGMKPLSKRELAKFNSEAKAVHVFIYRRFLDSLPSEYQKKVQDKKKLVADLKKESNKLFDDIFKKEFIIQMTYFEADLKDLCKQLYADKLFTKIGDLKKINTKDIAMFPDMSTYKMYISCNFMDDMPIRRVFKRLVEDVSSLDEGFLVLDKEIKKILEFIARRNIFIHKKSIVDEQYFKDAEICDNSVSLGIGDEIGVDINYLLDLRVTGQNLLARIKIKLGLPSLGD